MFHNSYRMTGKGQKRSGFKIKFWKKPKLGVLGRHLLYNDSKYINFKRVQAKKRGIVYTRASVILKPEMWSQAAG